MTNRTRRKQSFGEISKLPSGRFRARYTGPDNARHSAPHTFVTRTDADAWLSIERRLISNPDVEWMPPSVRAKRKRRELDFATFAESWLAHRRLAVRTREEYQRLLDRFILPAFGSTKLKRITPDMVREWYAVTCVDRPTFRARAYGLLRTILGSAVKDDLIDKNPCYIRGAGNAKSKHDVRPATLAQLETIATTMPERLRLMVMLAAWCALRFGEITELRRGDVDTKEGVLRIRRGVVRTKGGPLVKDPKSDAGSRDVSIPPHLLSLVREHLLRHAQSGKDGLLFPAASGGHLAPSTFYGRAPYVRKDGTPRPGWGYYGARAAAGRPDLHLHDLRHTGAVLAAQTGATLAELMNRLGHSTPGAAMRYQHAAQERDREIASRLSLLAGWTADNG
ncbi:site-specific integrase [Mumia zhuanghuii]|uniref:Tyrosine-type recombinase/integrase n=2 Tax=Mumia TaxID=1546255 RepID=A0ABW1QMA0_9ACTN|nr:MULTISPECIES: site-specific integrase [Mumia]KAA1423302.1 site-specific integrase [Mumia zhuanghuii]